MAPSRAEPTAAPSVLLIEDNPGDARLFEELLGESALAAEVRHEESLESGVRAARSSRPDVLVVDLGLPDSEGAATVDRLMGEVPDVPIVVLTGSRDAETAMEALRAGAADYLEKEGLRPRELGRTLRWCVERDRLEKRAEEQRALSYSILHSLPEHIAVLDGEGTILAVNEAWRAFAEAEGGDPRGYEGENYLVVTERAAGEESEGASGMLAGLRAVLAGERDRFAMEYPCHGPEERRWFRVEVAPLAGTAREGAVVSHLDITERKLAELEVEAERSRLKEVFEAAPSWVAVLRGPEHVFELANPAYRTLVGDRELIGRPVREAFPELEDQGFFEMLDRVYETGEPTEVVEEPVELDRPDEEGTRRVYLSFVYQPRRREGEVVGVIAHGIDVTEQVEARVLAETAEERYRTLFSESPIGIAVVGADGTPSEVNDVLVEMLGYDADELTSMHFEEFTHPEDVDRDEHLYEQLVDGEIPEYRIEKRYLTADGDVLWADLRVTRVRLPGSEEEGEQQVAFVSDITDRVEARAQLEQSEEKWSTAIELAPTGIAISDAETGRVFTANEAAASILGYRPEEMLESTVDELGTWEDRAERTALVELVGEQGVVEDEEVRLRHRSGEVRHVRMSARRLQVAGEDHLLWTLHDVTEQKRLEEELRHQALHDSLTGLANRSLFEDRLRQALARGHRHGTPVGLLLLDIDRFKQVNDHLGHAAGDRLLEEMGRRLADEVRAEDTAARLGGDEFAVLLPELSGQEDFLSVKERLDQVLAEPFRLMGEDVDVDITMGAVLECRCDVDQAVEVEDPDDLVRYADLALYEAKKTSGPAFRLFRPSEDRDKAAFLGREQELRRGIREEEFSVLFQPIVRLADGGVWGVEPLARWDDPRRGRVLPGEFIPLAEETGLIHELGELLFREICREAREWSGPDREVRVTPNLSGRQFERRDLVDTLHGIARDAGLDPSRFWLEITESAITRTPAKVEALRELGFQVLVDDFGTGYSSFHYLRDLDVDGVKIDMSFVQSLDRSRTDRALVETMITMGRTMEMVVVAEGIETDEQREILAGLGCDLGQGYLFARPGRAETIAERARETGT